MQPAPGGPLPTGERPSVDELSQLPLSFNFYIDQSVIFNPWDGLALWEVAPFTGAVEWGDGQDLRVVSSSSWTLLSPLKYMWAAFSPRGGIWAVWVRGITSALWQNDLHPSILLAVKKKFENKSSHVFEEESLENLKTKHNTTEHKPIAE